MMYSFNQFWIDSDPENVMEFPRLRDTFARHVETELVDRPVIIRLILDSWLVLAFWIVNDCILDCQFLST